MGDFVGAHAKPPQSKKKLSALQRSSQARQRMRSIREEATAPGTNTPLTLQVPSDPSYWAKIVSDNRPIDGLMASELVILASCRGMGAFQAMPGVIVTTSSTMKCCDGNCVDGHSRLSVVILIDPGFMIKVKVCACVMCVQYRPYDNNISPSLLIIKIIILYFIQIRHTDAFPPTGTLLVIIMVGMAVV